MSLHSPILTQQLDRRALPTPIWGLRGKDATLFHYCAHGDPDSLAPHQAEQSPHVVRLDVDNRRPGHGTVTNKDLATLLARTSAVLLDFDGPICAVFSDFTAKAVVDEMRERLGTILDDAADTDDPFELLTYAARKGTGAAAAAHDQLTRLEVRAVNTAAATSGAADVLMHFATAGRPVVVVSNNSLAAVRVYLDAHGLGRYVAAVSARTEPDPSLLKPNPYLIRAAAELLATTAGSCLMVGDSISDIQAAHAAAAPVVAFANKAGKRARLQPYRPDLIIQHMADLRPSPQRIAKRT